MVSKFKFNWRKVLLVASFVTPFIVLALAARGVSSEHANIWIQKAGAWGPVVYVFAMLSTFIFAPLSGSPVLFAGFFAFKSKVIWFTFVAAFLASVINFWIARRWGRDITERLVGGDNIKKIDKIEREYGLIMLVFLRLFQGGIHEFVSYAAGLTRMKFSSYVIVSTVSMIPGSVLWYYLSFQTDSIVSFSVLNFSLTIFFAGLFIVFVFLLKIVRK
ncbi:MAG: TVP38/TMEM64 family protein [Candidatus Blackburnbacteria bacterium]|nr:TVP38/TMEM64 family protein [Candidatus Blackburnbacteria bacterium]